MSHEGIRIAPKEDEARQSDSERPLPRISITPEKVRVLITEGRGMEIDWIDGHKSAWSFAWLRLACPCATCVEERKAEGRKARPAQTQARRPTAHVHSAREARDGAPSRPLRYSVQLARRPYRRHLLLGVSAPRLPVQRMYLCGHRNHWRTQLSSSAIRMHHSPRTALATSDTARPRCNAAPRCGSIPPRQPA